MTVILDKYTETEELGGGQYRKTIYQKPIAYDDSGIWTAIDSDWQDGLMFPHVVTASPFTVSVGDNGSRRIHPTREPEKYFELGRPAVKIGGVWQQPNLNAFSRNGNRLQSINAQSNIYLVHGGHFLKIGVLLKGGYVPEDKQIAFPVNLVGLSRQGTTIYDGTEPVMILRKMVVWDYDVGGDDPEDIYDISHSIVQLNGQRYIMLTLPPEVDTMAQPLIDPTYESQPDAAAGNDTLMNSSAPATNYGAATTIPVGESNTGAQVRRSLIKFDLSSIPSAATISNTTLDLYMIGEKSSNTRTKRVYRQKRVWVESEATWNSYSTGNNWATAGGFGAADCEQTDIGSISLAAAEAVGHKEISLTGANKAALDLGNGWLLKSDTENNDQHTFSSSDVATADQRPKLTIVYTVTTAPPHFMHYSRMRRS